jgi:hypothetical protein
MAYELYVIGLEGEFSIFLLVERFTHSFASFFERFTHEWRVRESSAHNESSSSFRNRLGCEGSGLR